MIAIANAVARVDIERAKKTKKYIDFITVLCEQYTELDFHYIRVNTLAQLTPLVTKQPCTGLVRD